MKWVEKIADTSKGINEKWVTSLKDHIIEALHNKTKVRKWLMGIIPEEIEADLLEMGSRKKMLVRAYKISKLLQQTFRREVWNVRCKNFIQHEKDNGIRTRDKWKHTKL